VPKEITHWLIGAASTEKLNDTALGRAAADHPHCLKLGAVFPDALFYNRNGSKTKQYTSLADEFHGSGGEDTYQVVRDLYRAVNNSADRGPLMAFFVGLVSHIQADSSFHPLVFYVSGDYDHPDPLTRAKAVGSHRRFESLMDLYFCGGFKELNSHSLKTMLQKAESPLTALMEGALSEIALEKGWPELVAVTARAFGFFAFMQGLSHNRALSRTLYALDGILPDTWREVIGLFYGPQLLRKMPLMSEPFQYRNPVTGQEFTQRLDEIFQTAVDRTASICQTIEPALINGDPFPIPDPGPSLAFGLEGASTSQANFFKEEPFI